MFGGNLLPFCTCTRSCERANDGKAARSLSKRQLSSRLRRYVSLRSKRFRGVWERRKTEERDFWYFAYAENALEPHRNACYAGYRCVHANALKCNQTTELRKLIILKEKKNESSICTYSNTINGKMSLAGFSGNMNGIKVFLRWSYTQIFKIFSENHFFGT